MREPPVSYESTRRNEVEIIKKLSAVMEAVGAVRKGEKNQSQGFNFRGIDSVVNAVSPALRKEGVVVVPRLLDSQYETVTVGRNATQMGHARVTVEYAFYAPDGSNITATVAAESMDSGDKATAKAMSVAFRTALLQALCLPTDEVDPDAESYERSPKPAAKIPGVTSETIGNRPQDAKPKKVGQSPVKGVGLTAVRQKWVTEQIALKYPGEDVVVFVGDIIDREIGSLDEVSPDEAKAVIERLAK